MRPRPLDPIELQVLSQYANGKSTEEIGDALGVHKGVVQDHLRIAVRKLGAANRVHAAVIATATGIIRITGFPAWLDGIRWKTKTVHTSSACASAPI